MNFAFYYFFIGTVAAVVLKPSRTPSFYNKDN